MNKAPALHRAVERTAVKRAPCRLPAFSPGASETNLAGETTRRISRRATLSQGQGIPAGFPLSSRDGR